MLSGWSNLPRNLRRSLPSRKSWSSSSSGVSQFFGSFHMTSKQSCTRFILWGMPDATKTLSILRWWWNDIRLCRIRNLPFIRPKQYPTSFLTLSSLVDHFNSFILVEHLIGTLNIENGTLNLRRKSLFRGWPKTFTLNQHGPPCRASVVWPLKDFSKESSFQQRLFSGFLSLPKDNQIHRLNLCKQAQS